MIQIPEAFKNQIRQLLGPEAEEFFASYALPASRGLRLNPLHPESADAAREFVTDSIPWCRFGKLIKTGSRPGTSIAHFSGAFYMQEPAAMAPVMALDPKPGETVLDLCAAPGGKSTEILSCMMGEGALLANEIDGKRARVLASNIERMGFWNAAVTSESPDKLAKILFQAFDAVLVDAPCSGEGMFRREPDSVSEWTESSPAGCANRQRQVLFSAAQLVRPGGRMCYSTCTFNTEENEGTVEHFLSSHPEFELLPFDRPGLSSPTGIHRLWPHKHPGEGHFMALFQKKGDKKAPLPAQVQDRAALPLLKILKDELKLDISFHVKAINGDLYSAPNLPPLKGLHVISPGARLTETVGKTVRPAHALSRLPLDFENKTELSAADAARYLDGEEITSPGTAGWTLVTHQNLPLGFGKRSGDTVKNHLPKGLRIKIHP